MTYHPTTTTKNILVSLLVIPQIILLIDVAFWLTSHNENLIFAVENLLPFHVNLHILKFKKR